MRSTRRLARTACASTLLALAVGCAPAHSESAEDFFRGKQISLFIGYNPGGSYDAYGRIAANFLPRYIPGHPTVVAKNLPGVGSVKAANFLHGQAPRDGLTIGVIGQALAVTQALHENGAEYDMRQFNWLGRFTSAVELTMVWHTSPTRTIADAMRRETVLAGTSSGGTTDLMPRVMNRIAGTRFKIAKGYAGTAGMVLAMERGETEGCLDSIDSLLFLRGDWLREGKVRVLVQYAPERHWALPDVPAMVEFGSSQEDKQLLALFASTAEVGRSLMAPPGIPAERVAVLRQAFDAMVADPAFREEVEKRKMEFEPMAGAELQRRIVRALDVSPAVIARAMAINRD
jgi:tripartite-type tricarboxylate transporter receptor subunit TctC